MIHRHKKPNGHAQIPRIWMMTDPRLGENLAAAVQRLPAGSGVIFRHYDLEPMKRKTLFCQIARVCRRRGHVILLAGTEADARNWHADGVHGLGRALGASLRSVPVHNVREIAQARRIGADIMLLSPVFATRSHPGQRPLGAIQFQRLAALSGSAKLIALGGMTRQKAAMFRHAQIDGWAAIDAFIR
jgi:thiamine-phosphate pyrophosphorylase